MSHEESPVGDNVLEAYWRVVRDDSGNFDGWINLLQYVEQLDDSRECRKAYDAFLARFPYCYGYWCKYADMEKRHHHTQACLDVYEKGVQAIPLSIDLWLSYIAFYKDYIHDSSSREKKTRNLYEKAIESAGLEFRSDRLWDDYIAWERDADRYKEVLALYDRLLEVPTLMYSMHFDKIQEFVNNQSPEDILLAIEYYELFRSIESKLKEKNIDMYIIEPVIADKQDTSVSTTSDTPTEETVKKGFASPPTTALQIKKEGGGVDEVSAGAGGGAAAVNIKQERVDADQVNGENQQSGRTSTGIEYRKTFSEEALKLFRLLILDKRRRIHLENEREVSKRWSYEDAIKRPYFHVKPLERAQLKNWRAYLDFEITQGDKKRIGVLFERALIACAMYEDIWIKYARYMETISPEPAREIYQRACYTHLPKKPNPRLAWAAFEESRNNLIEARKILKDFADKNPGLVTIELRRIGLERRELAARHHRSSDSADYSDIVKMYESLIRHKADTPRVASFYAVKYARFVCKIKCDRRLAQKILLDAISRDQENVQLHLQLIEMAYQSQPVDQELVLNAFKIALDSKIPSMEKLSISQRKLEFLEDLGTDVQELQDHYEWHLKFSKSLGVSTSRKRPPDDAGVQPPFLPPEKRAAPDPSHGNPGPPITMVPAGQAPGPPYAIQPAPTLPGPQPGQPVYYDYSAQQYPHQWNQHGAYYYPPPY